MTQPPYRDFLRQEYHHAEVNTVGRILKKYLLNVKHNYSVDSGLFGLSTNRYEKRLKLVKESEIRGIDIAQLCKYLPSNPASTWGYREGNKDLASLIPSAIVNLKKVYEKGIFTDTSNSKLTERISELGTHVLGLSQKYRFPGDHSEMINCRFYNQENIEIDICIYDRDTLDSLIGNISDIKTEARCVMPRFEAFSQTRNMIAHVLDKIARRDEGLISQNPFEDL